MNYNLEKLKAANKSNTPLFSFNGLVTFAKAVDFYDGDTFNIIISHYDSLYHFKARMYGYDSPEMKPALSLENREEIKKNAVRAKNRLTELLGSKECFKVYCHEFDKYGRLLVSVISHDDAEVGDDSAYVYDFNKTVNAQMIKEGHGYTYYGGTKQKS
jgi:endonuclease YncB( thermonuclease family)